MYTVLVYILDEGPSLETSKFSLHCSGSCIPTNESTTYIGTDMQFKIISRMHNLLMCLIQIGCVSPN